jgi:hypothetical protein
MNLTFKYQFLIIILVILAGQARGQVPDYNSIQPDSVYHNNKVKRIFVYDNSPKDLGKIIEVDINGHFTKILLYSASYDKATRARKGIEITVRYVYNSKGQLIERIDSASYVTSSEGTDRTCYFYDTTGVLKTSTYYRRQYLDTKTEYGSSPFRSITIRRSLNDSLITYQDVTEYDRDFYKKSWWGYSRESTLKTITAVKGTDTIRGQYSDDKDLSKQEWVEEDINRFNAKGQLISSNENQHFTSVDGWKPFQTTYFYSYYKNGLLKGGGGGYYKYEFYKGP